ncbi:CvpA family protein [Ideonella paludis]|uniref:CvpA family protein n=1 Tax=Ideonella paludis TaxID=1233411 RepID=A0ABS5DXM8_9BURK|nr:CvpA family protein [Ideonella paludis]
MQEALPPLTSLDWAVLAGLLLSVLMGLWRGLVFEVLSLLGWLAAWWAAQSFSGWAAAQLPWGAADSIWRAMGAYGLVFTATLLACGLLARLARLLVAATPLSLPDRFFGAVFGLLRGVLIALVLTTLVLWTPLAKTDVWKASWVANTLTEWVRQLQPLFPQWPGLKAWLPEKLEVPGAPSLF